MAKKILLVDDDEGFLLAAGQLLEAAGYEVTRSSGAAEARVELDKALPDLILLDVIMPGKDGFVFSDELAKEERLKEIPVVLVTAVAENTGQMMRAFAQDKAMAAVNILPKSAAHKDLVNTVAAALASN